MCKATEPAPRLHAQLAAGGHLGAQQVAHGDVHQAVLGHNACRLVDRNMQHEQARLPQATGGRGSRQLAASGHVHVWWAASRTGCFVQPAPTCVPLPLAGAPLMMTCKQARSGKIKYAGCTEEVFIGVGNAGAGGGNSVAHLQRRGMLQRLPLLPLFL